MDGWANKSQWSEGLTRTYIRERQCKVFLFCFSLIENNWRDIKFSYNTLKRKANYFLLLIKLSFIEFNKSQIKIIFFFYF